MSTANEHPATRVPAGPLATLLEKYERTFPGIDLFVVKSYRLKKLVGASTVFPEEVRCACTMVRCSYPNCQPLACLNLPPQGVCATEQALPFLPRTRMPIAEWRAGA